MKRQRLVVSLLLLFLSLGWSQDIERRRGLDERPEVKLPNGKTQTEEILKVDHEKTLEDASRLVKLAEELQDNLIKDDRHVLSIAALKKTEEIEKLAKRIRTRLKH